MDKVRLVGRHGYMDHYDMYEALGLKSRGHLPDHGMETREIQGVKVYVAARYSILPHNEQTSARGGVNWPPKKGKSSRHRVFVICTCGRHVPFGRLHQHKH